MIPLGFRILRLKVRHGHCVSSPSILALIDPKKVPTLIILDAKAA